jgi:hypothetical protein
MSTRLFYLKVRADPVTHSFPYSVKRQHRCNCSHSNGNHGWIDQLSAEKWISFGTTHIMKMLNEEFRRRTQVTKIALGQTACDGISAYRSSKPE